MFDSGPDTTLCIGCSTVFEIGLFLDFFGASGAGFSGAYSLPEYGSGSESTLNLSSIS